MMQPGPLVLIGLDALEARELEPRLADGRMPNLARLLGNRPLRPMSPDVPGFPDGVWRSFINGRPIGEHGWYFNKQWRPESGRIEATSTSWLQLRPFWSRLAGAGARLAILDMPHLADPGPDFPGIHLTGWQTHDPDPLVSRPQELLGEIKERFGKPLMPRESYGSRRPADLLAMREAVLASVEQFADIIIWTLGREQIDLLIAVFGAAHRIGHYLWDLSQLDTRDLEAEQRALLENALDDVYAALDHAVGRIVEAAPRQARIVVFALHGMGLNPGWTELLPQILPRLPSTHNGRRRSAWRNQVDHLRRNALVIRASQMLPRPMTRLLGSAWTSRMHDWKTTRVFNLPAERRGLLRVNLVDREPHGSVEPGSEYEDLLASLEDALRGITVIDDAQPLVESVHRPLRLVPETAPYRAYLPDLSIEWREVSLTASSGLRFADGSTIRWPAGRRLSSGRSGEHRSSGWLVADSGFASDEPTVVDLAAAVAGHFGLGMPAEADAGDAANDYPGRRRITARRGRAHRRPIQARRGRPVLARSPA